MTTIGVFSHATRSETLARTLQSLNEVGLQADYVSVQDGKPSAVHNRLNAMTALANAFNDTDVLILEDDVLAGNTVPAWLDYLRDNVQHVTCLLPMKPEFYSVETEVSLRNPRAARIPGSRLEANPQLMHWWGSQAVWFPRRHAQNILANDRFYDAEHGIGPWDHAIRRYLMDTGEDMLSAYPAVFQHQSPPSVRQRQNKRLKQAAIFDPNAEPPL